MSLTFGFMKAGRTLPLASLAIKGGTATRIWVGRMAPPKPRPRVAAASR
jgi:hypothetical protein